jgi:hypothetical protein
MSVGGAFSAVKILVTARYFLRTDIVSLHSGIFMAAIQTLEQGFLTHGSRPKAGSPCYFGSVAMILFIELKFPTHAIFSM